MPYGIALVLAIIAILVALWFRLESPLSPAMWKDPFPLPALDGHFRPNHELQKAERLLVDRFSGPESFAFDRTTGRAYTGVAGGRLIEIEPDGKEMRNIFFVGGKYVRNSELLLGSQLIHVVLQAS
jgi:hypothetical protein